MTGRTSTVPTRATGMRAAMPSALSRSLASIKKKPPNCSRVSANGPSVTSRFPRAGLALVDTLSAIGDLDGYHLLHAARADLLRRLGSSEEATKSYRRALELVTNDSERRYLERRLREVQPD